MYLNFKNYEAKYKKYKTKYVLYKALQNQLSCAKSNLIGGECVPLPNPEEEDIVSTENLLDLCPEERITIKNKCYEVNSLYKWIIEQNTDKLPLTQIDITRFDKQRLIKAYKKLIFIPNILTRDKLIQMYPNLQQERIIDTHDINYTGISLDTFNNLPRLTQLILRKTKITEFMFNDSPRLWNLNLSYNKIRNISNWINNLSMLRCLNLSYNQISKLELGLFDNLSKLEYLYLDHNKISVLQLGLFDNLSKLIELYLNDNQIITLQQGLFDNLPALIQLYLSGNYISGIENTPNIFSNLLELKILHLEGNQIRELPPGIFNNLTKLESVHRYNNQIETVHDPSYYGLSDKFIMI